MGRLFPFSRHSHLNSDERKGFQDIEFFLKAIPFSQKRDMMYIDLCCGTGYFTLPVAKRLGDNGAVYAIDIQGGMLSELKKIIMEQKLKNIMMIQGDILSLFLKEKTADIVNIGNSLHELKQPETSLREIKRILKPDGKFIIVDWEKTESPFGPPVNGRISSEEAIGLLEKVGFKSFEKLSYPRYFYLLTCHL